MSSGPRPHLNPASKRARTRERLLDVAAELFQARGIAAVSLDEVAAGAGVTKGAIYGSFAGKDDLLFAVASERLQRALVAFDASAPLKAQLRRMVREAFGGSPNKRAQFAFLAELDLYALTRPDLAARFVASAGERHARSARQLEAFAAELRMPPHEFVVAVQGVVGGLAFQHACFPEVVTEDVAMTVLEGLLAASPDERT